MGCLRETICAIPTQILYIIAVLERNDRSKSEERVRKQELRGNCPRY
jgi:hypothetical protein